MRFLLILSTITIINNLISSNKILFFEYLRQKGISLFFLANNLLKSIPMKHPPIKKPLFYKSKALSHQKDILPLLQRQPLIYTLCKGPSNIIKFKLSLLRLLLQKVILRFLPVPYAYTVAGISRR